MVKESVLLKYRLPLLLVLPEEGKSMMFMGIYEDLKKTGMLPDSGTILQILEQWKQEGLVRRRSNPLGIDGTGMWGLTKEGQELLDQLQEE